MSVLFLLSLLSLASAPAHAEGDESSLTVEEYGAPLPQAAPAPDTAPPETAEEPLDAPPPRKEEVKVVESPRFTSSHTDRFHRYLFTLCSQEPVAVLESTRRLAHGRENVFRKPANKLGSLRLLLENYADAVEAGGRTTALLKETLRKEFYELRDASELSGKKESAREARALLAKIESENACQTRSTQEGVETKKRKRKH